MARPLTFANITDIPLSTTNPNVLSGIPESQLTEAAQVEMFFTRETVDVQASAKVGSDNVLPQSPVNVVAAVGTLPSLRDDRLIISNGFAGDFVSVLGVNADAAAARELRTVVRITAIGDVALRDAMMKQQGALV